MPSATVRISETARETLRDLAERTGESMQEILERAVEEYRRQRFLEDLNAGFAALRNDPDAWKEVLDEREEWEHTLSDGLSDE